MATKPTSLVKHNKSSYVFFCEDFRFRVKDQYPDTKITKLSEILARWWRELPVERKEHYENLARLDKIRYDAELAADNSRKALEGALKE